ncbi:ankyrin repeat domain-containing protein [Streptomyces sp. NBC_00873]|uniref:ankyrin repeat domain-containing protein n=1 Tax=unclassified Streptomyces TaxID=2593676 RepID=UPI003864A910|nr:ankyrin repeat domain-containing protein [Streptomyces sp. NBC_00873]WTA42075.1 ankyrin repeat domain-containing protein [Streptomyces sp. NBC_00842]
MTRGDQGRDRMGRTAVHYAAADGDVDGLRELVAIGADPDAADNAGWTPLHFAAQAQNPQVSEALLGAGAAVDVPDRHGNTALWTAVFNSRGEAATLRILLAAGADPDRENTHGVSPRGLANKIANYDAAGYMPRIEELSS